MAEMYMDVDVALSEVPVNIMPLIDNTDFITRETGIVYNQAGMDLVWNFTTTSGATTQTAVTPTSAGDYDWAHQGDGMYTIEIPASGGASINNDTEGQGWFTGICTGVLAWRGPIIVFRAAGLNNILIDSAYSATRGLAGTALPDAVADSAGGLPISDAGGLDLDSRLDVAVSSRLAPTVTSRTLDVTTNGNAGIDWANVENPSTVLDLAGTDINLVDTTTTNTDMRGTDSALLAASVNVSAGVVESNVKQISDDSVAADNLELQYDTTGLTGDTFPSRQDQLGNLSSGSSGYSINASGVVVTTGTETNSYTDTFSEGVIHIVSADGGNTDFYYTYDLSVYSGTATEFIWKGYVQTIGDSVQVQYYNWATTSWLTLQTLDGSPGTTTSEIAFDIPVGATGTGANFGKVRMRFLSTTTTNIGTDRVRCVFNQSIGGITNGSTITLGSAITNQNFVGSNWNLVLNSQDVTGAYVAGAVVEGISSGSGGTTFEDCYFKTATVPPGTYVRCGFGRDSGVLTGASAGDYTFIKCFSNIAGDGSPDLVFSGLGAPTTINNRGWNGGSDYTLDSDCTLSHEVHEGGDQFFTTGGADVELRGIFRSATYVLSGAGLIQQIALTGPVTISGTSTATVNIYGISSALSDTSVNTTVNDYTHNNDSIADAVWDEILTGATHNIATSAGKRLRDLASAVIITGTSPDTGGTANTSIRIELDGNASSINGTYDPATIDIVAGTGAGQSRQIWEYDGPNKYAYVSRDFKTIPDNTSEYVIKSNAGDTHVNEGLVTGATLNTVTLNSLASSDDGAYIGQFAFISAGTGADQSIRVSGYNGTTKVATLDSNWVTVPVNGESIYAMLPYDAACRICVDDIDTKTDTLITGVDLNDDAITASKYDETTAFPVASVDSGSTQIARTGADGDTLETISDQIDNLATSGSPVLLQSTTIATLASQISFTLTAGSPDDNAYNDQVAIITDQSTSTQKAVAVISDYTGLSRTVTLTADPAVFTMAVGDSISIVASKAFKAVTERAQDNAEYFFNASDSAATKNVNDVGVAGSGFDPDTHIVDGTLTMTEAIKKTNQKLIGERSLASDGTVTYENYDGTAEDLALKKDGNNVTRTVG